MKHIIYILLFSITLISCKDNTIDDVNTGIYDHTPYIQKEWKLVNVIQLDDKAGPGKLKSLDITDAILGNTGSNLIFDGENFEATGVLEQTLGSSGNWSFDDDFFPTTVRFDAGDQSKLIPLGQSLTSFSEELKLKAQSLYCGDGSVATSYEYVFEKN